jgi:hypothetical protein
MFCRAVLVTTLVGLGSLASLACDRQTAENRMTEAKIVELAREIAIRRWPEQVVGWAKEKQGPPRCLEQPPQVTRTGAGFRVFFEHGNNAPSGGTRVIVNLDRQGNELSTECHWDRV